MTEFKIVMLGAGGVGKSALTMQFVRGSFIENYDPTVEDLYTKSIEFNNKSYLLEILDTAGVEQFASMSDLYIRNGHGFILVYSITSSQSFKEIESLQQKICRIKQSNRVPIVVAGNKADLEFDRKVPNSNSFDKRQTNSMNMRFMELTAKDNGQVNNLYYELLNLMRDAAKRGNGNPSVLCDCSVS